MSFGYYRVGSHKDPKGAIARLASAMGYGVATTVAQPPVQHAPIERRASPAAPMDMEPDPHGLAKRRLIEVAVGMGYTGDQCNQCMNFTMVRNGTCLKCDTCGSTTGCS